MSEIKSKLESLKTLRSEMKDWKKQDLRKKKGVKDPEPKEEPEEKAEASQLARVLQRLLSKE